MLRELNQLGTQLQLSPLGFGEVIVHWQVALMGKNAAISLLEETPEGKSKPKPGQALLAPSLRRNGDEPLLIDDGGEYVFGVGERGEKRRLLYLDLLDRCIAETNDEGAILVQEYLSNCNLEEIDRQISQQIPPKIKRDGTPEPREPFWWARDRFIFTFEGERITYRPAIKQWWGDYFASKQDTEAGLCLLTGEQTRTMGRKMPALVKGVPNTQSSGAAITSFDKAAYQSHGWEGNANAAIGFEVAVKLHQVLAELLKANRHHFRSGSLMFVFWGDVAGEGINPEVWNDPAAAMASELFATPDRPSRLPGDRALSRKFYLATLKGNKGRIALSSWDERSPEQIKQNVQQFISCQEFAPGERAKPIWVLRNCAFFDPNKEYPDKIATALVQAALLGKPLPDEYAIRIINRICQERDTFGDAKKPCTPLCNFDRAKALMFYWNTKQMNPETTPEPAQQLSRDRLAYILGKAAFLMHWAQVTAQKLQSEDTNVSRSLKALSTTPASVFPRLYAGCIVNHLEDRDALQDETRSGLLKKVKRHLNDTFAELGDYNPDTDLPSTFGVREQTQFFIGFAKCRAEFFKKGKE